MIFSTDEEKAFNKLHSSLRKSTQIRKTEYHQPERDDRRQRWRRLGMTVLKFSSNQAGQIIRGGSWDRVLHWARCSAANLLLSRSAANLLLSRLPLPLPTCACLLTHSNLQKKESPVSVFIVQTIYILYDYCTDSIRFKVTILLFAFCPILRSFATFFEFLKNFCIFKYRVLVFQQHFCWFLVFAVVLWLPRKFVVYYSLQQSTFK